MTLVGVTGIEDKVQTGVPETIASLLSAGIKVWVLTGDKQETAVNIGYSCKLLKPSMEVLTVTGGTVKKRLKSILKSHRKRTNNELGLVIDGESLTHICADVVSMKHFSMVACLCLTVICCRMSPLQKASVVRFVRNHFSFNPVTLAIGDGANDVSMIQEAHVGVGISGKEGLQAVNSSDYAIARFQFLSSLLFVHGRWNYQRISIVILYSFYKNFLLVLPMFFYSFANQYSGTALYDSWLLMSYNVVLTAVPIVILGTLDKDLARERVLSSPTLYLSGILSRKFNVYVFLRWTVVAVVHSAVIYCMVVVPAGQAIDARGNPENLILLGTVTFYSIVQTASYVILLEMKDWSPLFILILLLSNCCFFGYVFVYDKHQLPTQSLIGVLYMMFTFPMFTASMLLTPLVCILINLSGLLIQVFWFPTYLDQVRKREVAHRVVPQVLYQEPALYSDAPNVMPIRTKQFLNKLAEVFDPKGMESHSGQPIMKDSDLKRFTLRFNNQFLEEDYRKYRIQKTIGIARNLFVIILAMNFTWTLSVLFLDGGTPLTLLRVFIVVLAFGVVLVSRTQFFLYHYEAMLLCIIVSALTLKTVLDVTTENDGSMTTAIALVASYVFFDTSTYKVLIINSIFLLVHLIGVTWRYS